VVDDLEKVLLDAIGRARAARLVTGSGVLDSA
jgi:hypothetical protein